MNAFEQYLEDMASRIDVPPSRIQNLPPITVRKATAYLPMSTELALDYGLITEEQARAQGWQGWPERAKVSRWRRLRWRMTEKRERLGRRVGGWIAGVDLSERDGDDW
jgi:hypothetical protein